MKRRIHLGPIILLLLAFGWCVLQYLDRTVPNLGEEQAQMVTIARSVLSLEPSQVRHLRTKEYPTSEEGHYEYYYQQLSQQEQVAYRQMLEALRNWEKEFYLTISEDEQIDLVYHAVLNDHPELFWVRNRNPVYKTLYGGRSYSSFLPSYSYAGPDESAPWESDVVTQVYARMEEAVEEISAQLGEEASDYHKAYVTYEWVVDHTEYLESDDDQSIAGVFWRGEAVCAGYAAAYQYLLERLGVPCIYVEGESTQDGEGHAWNIVKLDGSNYYVDVTNGDQPEFLTGDAASLQEHKTVVMDYLCPFPWEYEKLYRERDLFELPKCTETAYNFYVLGGGCMDYYDPDYLNDYFRMRIDNGAVVIRYKFTNENAYKQAAAQWGESPQLEDAIQYFMERNGLNQVQYHYGLLENLLTMYYIF